MLEEDTVRNNFYAALKEVKHGEELAPTIGYTFSTADIKTLARLHRENKCKRKIEELLDACHFCKECQDFKDG